VGEGLAFFFDNQTPETLIFRPLQLRIVAQNLDCRGPGALL
jgi:hypothetical protein